MRGFIAAAKHVEEVTETLLRTEGDEAHELRSIRKAPNVEQLLKKRQQKNANGAQRVSADDGASTAVPEQPPLKT